MHRADDRPHILVVEDEADVQQLITFILERAGYTVTCVSGRLDAEAAIFLHDFDAAVIDLCLPDGRGDQLVRRLRSQSPRTRIVVTSAFAHSSLVLQSAAESGDLFLAKPFANAALVSAVTSMAAGQVA